MAESFTLTSPITSNNYNILSIFNNFKHPVLGSKWETCTRWRRDDIETEKIGGNGEEQQKHDTRQHPRQKHKSEEQSATRRKTKTFSNPCAHRKTFRRKNLITRYCTLILNQLFVCSWDESNLILLLPFPMYAFWVTPFCIQYTLWNQCNTIIKHSNCVLCFHFPPCD